MLSTMEPAQLKIIARAMGIDENALNDVEGECDPKAKLIQMISGTDPQGLNLSQLKQTACALDIDDETVQGVDDSDDPKATVIQLISKKMCIEKRRNQGTEPPEERKRILIVGSTGDGKSTLINNLKEEAEVVARYSTDAEGTTKKVHEYKCKRNRLVIDTPGIGTRSVNFFQLFTMVEEVLGRGLVDAVVVTSALNNPKFHLGSQVVQLLVQQGFLRDGGDAWEHIIICGTKKDKADPEEIEAFRQVVRIFYEDAPNKGGVSVMVDKNDIRELDGALGKTFTEKISWKSVEEEVVAKAFAATLGLEQINFLTQFNKERMKVEHDRREIDKIMAEMSGQQQRFDEAIRELTLKISQGLESKKEAEAQREQHEKHLEKAWKEKEELLEKFQLWTILRNEVDAQSRSNKKMVDLQFEEAARHSKKQTRGEQVPVAQVVDRNKVSLKELKTIARARGASQQELDDADDEEDPKDAVDKLIVAKEEGFKKMSLARMKKIALDKGATRYEVDQADDEDDPKGAVMRLMSRAPSSKKQYDIFCCHTKSSNKPGWSCTDFVNTHIVEFFDSTGIRSFFDVLDLCSTDAKIDDCLMEAGQVKIMLVVLDDQAPTDWMQREIKVALDKSIPVKTIFRRDLFKWQEVGKPAWSTKGVQKELVDYVFERSAIQFDGDPLFVRTSKYHLMRAVTSMIRPDDPTTQTLCSDYSGSECSGSRSSGYVYSGYGHSG